MPRKKTKKSAIDRADKTQTAQPGILFTRKQCAERWQCSTEFVKLEIRRGNLRELKLGKLSRITLDDEQRYLASRLRAGVKVEAA